MHPIPRFIALTALFLFAGPGLGAPAATRFVADYEVYRNGSLLGEATISVTPGTGGSWQMSTITRGTAGLAAVTAARIEETSTFQREGGRIETRSYRYRQKVAFKERVRSLQVDPARQTITLNHRDAESIQPYAAGVLDRQILTLALMDAVAAGRRGDLRFTVADRLAVQEQVWRVAARVRLTTALGSMTATRMERIRESADGKDTRVWLAQDKGWIPVRILQVDDDETIEMRIRHFR